MGDGNWLLTILAGVLAAAAVACAVYAVLLKLMARQVRSRVQASMPDSEWVEGGWEASPEEETAAGGRTEAIEQSIRRRLETWRLGRQLLVAYGLAYPRSASLWPLINVGLLITLAFLLVLLLTKNLVGAVLLATAGLSAAYWRLLQVPARKRIDQIRMQLPDALTAISNVLRAGATIVPAVEQAAKESEAPLKEELERAVADVTVGQDLGSALSALRIRVPLDELGSLSAALLIQQRSGGDLPELLNSTATLLRDSVRLKNELRIQTQEGRQTGIVIGLLPVAVLGLLFVTNRQFLNPLLSTSIGRFVLFLSMSMIVLGLFLIRRIVNIKV